MKLCGKRLLFPVYDYNIDYWPRSEMESGKLEVKNIKPNRRFKLVDIINIMDECGSDSRSSSDNQDLSSTNKPAICGVESILNESFKLYKSQRTLFITDNIIDLLILNELTNTPAICVKTMDAFDHPENFMVSCCCSFKKNYIHLMSFFSFFSFWP